MKSVLIAHPEEKDNNIPIQTYAEHVYGVYNKCSEILSEKKTYLKNNDYNFLYNVVSLSAIYHDMGKLCHNCQYFFRNLDKFPAGSKMPNHVDAGTAYLLQLSRTANKEIYQCAAWLINSHHLGFQKNKHEDLRDIAIINNRSPWIQECDMRMKDYTDRYLNDILQKHNIEIKLQVNLLPVNIKQINSSLIRTALSILVDGDHHDTSKHYKNFIIEEEIELKSEERLAALDRYVNHKQKTCEPSIRNKNRQLLFEDCRNFKVDKPKFLCLSGSVGSGKTLGYIALSLKIASELKLTRIIDISPYIAVISQKVEEYRKSIILPNEDPIKVVAENHCSVEIEEEHLNAKIYGTTWSSPIVCTTAEQFCETISGYKTGKLRKYHNLIGSMIIIDESHCFVPPKFWPMTLVFLKELVENLNCVVLFVSGSITKPWKIRRFTQIADFNFEAKSILSPKTESILNNMESSRLSIQQIGGLSGPANWNKLDLNQICSHIIEKNKDGSVIGVFNTIKTTAVIADRLLSLGCDVMHLSTALCPIDREKLIEKIKTKLNNKENFILIATSCVEAGIDISFKHGFRENAGLLSIIQLGGRINRHNEYDNCTLSIFELKDNLFSSNSQLSTVVRIAREYYDLGQIGAEYCENALIEEAFTTNINQTLINQEQSQEMKAVSEQYQIIPDIKMTVIIYPQNLHEKSSFTDILRNSVQIYRSKENNFITNNYLVSSNVVKGVYEWAGNYDPNFLGYMAEFV